ncbi:MAG: S8 family peptidase [Bacteroidales bacterium]|nr:S8 family peptidase [Bacteroidales bacterium]MBN2758802.1 S8 family peptidase [Bacteroidales bacterium]
MMKKLLFGLLTLTLIIFISSCQKEDEIAKQDLPQVNDELIAGQYIVVLNNSTNKAFSELKYAEKVQFVKQEAIQLMNKIGSNESAVLNSFGTALRGFSAKLSDEQLANLKNDPTVSYIIQDRMFNLGNMRILRGKPVPVPVDPPAETIPYGITRVGYGDGTGRTAWIIDTGVDLDHPDLNVDASRGYDFINNDAFADDDNGHGSHCAGTVAGINNDIGVVGVAANATIVPVKVLDKRGSGAYSVIIAGVDFVAANASPGDAANMSLGGGVYEPIDAAVFAASEHGIFFALAAGNESDDALNHSPARVNGQYIWTTSAMDINDNWAYFSNYGTPVDYCMPGYNIYSTYMNGGYTTMSGTSMAAPHMCGVLLMTNGNPATDGYVNGDPDGDPDPIAHL